MVHQAAGLKIRRYQAEAGTHVWFTGIIDESFPADAFSATRGVVVIDLGGITRITSFGIREWINGLMGIEADALYFANVAVCVLPQVAMVRGFLGASGQVLSYQGLYECAQCGAALVRSFDRRSDADEAWDLAAPETLCAACKLPMVFGDLAESHRLALAQSGPLRDHPGLAAVAAAGETPAPSGDALPAAAKQPAKQPAPRATASHGAVAWTYPFEVSKQVTGNATVMWLSGTLDAVAGFRHVADGLEGDLVLAAPGIIGCDEAGVEVLRRMMETVVAGGGRVWLARCSPLLVAALARNPAALGTAAVLTSVEHGVPCPRCQVDTPYFMTCDAAGARGVFCGRCLGACATPNEALSASLAKLPCGPTPDWLRKLIAVPPAPRATVAASEAAPRWIWVLAAVSALALLASGVSAYVLLRPSKRHFVPRSESLTVEAPEPESEPESEPAPPAVGVPAATPTRTRTRPTGRTGVAASGPTANVAAGAVPPAVAAPTVAAPARDAHTLGELMRSHKAPGDSSPDIDSDAPLLPTQLTGDQINASLAALKGSVKDCYAQFREKGTVMVSGSVTPGGRLQEIEIGGVLAQTPTGTCALHAVRRASFPRFSGPAMTISYRYELP